MELHLTAMECHMPYDMGSHSDTCHPTQVNTPHKYPQPDSLILDLPTL